MAAPTGTTHFNIISGGAAVDFENETFEVATSATVILPWDTILTVAISQNNIVSAASTHPLFLAVGIEFYQQVNGEYYPLKNGAYNPLAVVKVYSGV